MFPEISPPVQPQASLLPKLPPRTPLPLVQPLSQPSTFPIKITEPSKMIQPTSVPQLRVPLDTVLDIPLLRRVPPKPQTGSIDTARGPSGTSVAFTTNTLGLPRTSSRTRTRARMREVEPVVTLPAILTGTTGTTTTTTTRRRTRKTVPEPTRLKKLGTSINRAQSRTNSLELGPTTLPPTPRRSLSRRKRGITTSTL
ncbi:hepatitis A virus cellular receptor 1-like [Arachis ipaensis]|uniref:hepatitis A virus cellular receptor 1-like n=1 Tax=Arachis ipaensis TaxID=130454 RepID=UPI0007AEECC1|nr:hepatitis A virus cellular receptor 1-like [Arachis ipaensis]